MAYFLNYYFLNSFFKRLILLIYFNIYFLTNCNAQNLVPNPSFEDTITCPHNLTQIDRAVGWSSYKESPDYFNFCDPPGGFGDVSVPLNSWGYQYPRSGNAYSGLSTYYTPGTNLREVMGIQLLQSLSIGSWYYVSFYASRAKSVNPYINVASSKLGVKLSTIPFSQSNPIPINNFAHLYSDTIITDTSNWVNIAGIVFADSAYNFLCIGNFFSDSLTSFIIYDSLSTVAYYYIDDISLILTDTTIQEVTGFNEIDLIKIFPNPVGDWIVVEGVQNFSLSISNAFGEVILSSYVIHSNHEILNVSFFPKGLYLLSLTKTNLCVHKKIIIY